MPPYYKSIPKKEFYNRYQALADPFGISLSQLGIDDKNPEDFFINEENGKSFLHEAAIQGNIQFINFLKDIGHDINLLDKEYRTPLYDACSRLKLASVNVLLDYGADPNLGNNHLTLQGNRYLDETDTLVNYQGETIPLVVTIDSVRMMAFEQLESRLNQPYTDDSSDSVMDNSAEKTAASIVEKLIQKGANVNLQTGPDHFSALHRAITYKYISLIKVIINSGQANPYLVDYDGETALHIVANYRQRIEKNFELTQMKKEKEIAELIIPYFNTLEIQEIKFGNTPLHSAVIRSNEFVVKLLYQKDHLFRHRKILSIQNKAGNTALHEAVNAAKQGPQILKLLLRVATNDELAIINKSGKTALQIAEDLLQESDQMGLLIQVFKKSEKKLDKLIDSFEHHMAELAKNKKIFKIFEWKPLNKIQITELQETINNLSSAIADLKDNKFFNEAIKEFELINDVESLSFNLKNYDQLVSRKKGDYSSNLIDTADRFHTQALKLVEDIDYNFLDKSYLESLTSVRQEEYFSWKNKILELPSSFPELTNVDGHLKSYKTNLNKANQLLFNAQTELTHSNIPGSNIRENVEAAIKLYQHLKHYIKLEHAYQILAKITLNEGQPAIAHYEEINRNKALSTNHQEKLQGHLALAGLYKEVLERDRTSPFLLPKFDKINELLARKAYYFYQAYKLTEGHLDSTTHVVLQRELGIAHNAKLGTYNIQQCIAVIAFDPLSKKVVLSHFDKFSGPLSFIDQLLNEFPEHTKINLYLSGARDRVSLASRTSTISDNNIEQVLKQIYAEKDRFVVRSSDLGDKLSPEAIVFDVASERLIHAVPNFPDRSLESREINFQLQWVKGDYLRPLNRVDFSKNEIARKISFSIKQQQQIYQRYLHYKEISGQTDAWNSQIFYPLMTLFNTLEGIPTSNYNDALLTLSNKLEVVPRVKQARTDIAIAIDENQENRNIAIDMGDTSHGVDPKQLPCLMLRRRRKRSLNCVLDSQGILDYLENLPDRQYAETLDYLASRTLGGTKEEEVSRLIYNAKIKIHLEKVNQFSSKLMNTLFAKDAISNLLKGDPSTAINLAAVLGANHLLVQTGEQIVEKGTRLLETGKVLPGQLLRASSPFVARGTSLLFGYDLYTQIKLLKKNRYDTDAWINVASDGIFLSMDALQIGIEVAEFSSEAIAALEISSMAGPVGSFVGGIVILGVQIYESVKKVRLESQWVHLTGWEKFKEGWRAFLLLAPEDSIKKKMNEAIEYKSLLEDKRKFLKNFPKVKFFTFPALKQVGETCRKVTSPCDGSFHYMTVLVSKKCPTKTVCTPKFTIHLDNEVYFKGKQAHEVKLPREVITAPSGSQLLCLPTTKEGIPPPPEIVYRCDGALGLNLTHNPGGKAALYDLGEGKDRIDAFDDVPNIFIVNNGEKRYVGGDKEDIFIVKASKVVSAFNSLNHLKGGLDGQGGIDTLNLKAFKPTAKKITIDLNQGLLKYKNNSETLAIKHIENLICGKFPLWVIVGCDTQKIDIAGGPTFRKADIIIIPKNSACYYTTHFYLKPNSCLTNKASQGYFTYIIQSGTGMISVNLSAEKTDVILSGRSLSQHHFIFNADVADLYALSSTEKMITFHFSEHKVNRILRAIQTIAVTKSDHSCLMLDYQFKPDSFLDNNLLALLPKLIKADPAQKKVKALFENYAINSTAIVNDQNKIHQILLCIIKTSDFIPNDFKVELTFSLSSNFFFHFFDGTEIKHVNGVNYLFRNGGQTIDDIMTFYSPIARRLNMICNIHTLLNQRILIGHYGHQVMHNDYYAYETHIVSNGGQVLLVIQPILPPVLATINEVILHHTPHSRNIDTLDFRQLKAKIHTELEIRSRRIKLFVLSKHNAHSVLLLVSKERKKIENDLLISLGFELSRKNTFVDFITVRLKNALLMPSWYQDHLHIILDVAPLKIVGNATNFYLKPIPLVLDATHEFVSIGAEDVEENTEIVIPKKNNDGQFYQHDKTNLIYTNTLSPSNSDKPFSILLKNFYKESKLMTLSFKFSNKDIVLTEELTALNALESFEHAKEKKEADLKKESRAILASKPIQPTQPRKKEHEFTTQNLTRQRRSIVNARLKDAIIDSVQETADAYYDRYDRMKEKPRLKKTVKSRKKLTLDITTQNVSHQSVSAPYKSKKTATTITPLKPITSSYKTDILLAKKNKMVHKYQPPSQHPPLVSKNAHFYSNNLKTKQKHTQLHAVMGTTSSFKEKITTQAHYLPQQKNTKTRNNPYVSHHQFKSGKSEGISRVTAFCDVQSTLFALNFAAKCFNKQNSQARMSPKIRRIQEKFYKQEAKARGIINN